MNAIGLALQYVSVGVLVLLLIAPVLAVGQLSVGVIAGMIADAVFKAGILFAAGVIIAALDKITASSGMTASKLIELTKRRQQ